MYRHQHNKTVPTRRIPHRLAPRSAAKTPRLRSDVQFFVANFTRRSFGGRAPPYSKVKPGIPRTDNIANPPTARCSRINLANQKNNKKTAPAGGIARPIPPSLLTSRIKTVIIGLSSGCGGTGRRAGFRSLWALRSWRFDSSHPHYPRRRPPLTQDLTEGPH